MYAEQGLEYEDCGSVASRKAASLAEEVYFPVKILMDMPPCTTPTPTSI